MKNALLFVLLAGALLVLGPLLDGPDDFQAAQDAADMAALAAGIAAMDARVERAARQICREWHGQNATHQWTERNELVCIAPPSVTTLTSKGTL